MCFRLNHGPQKELTCSKWIKNIDRRLSQLSPGGRYCFTLSAMSPQGKYSCCTRVQGEVQTSVCALFYRLWLIEFVSLGGLNASAVPGSSCLLRFAFNLLFQCALTLHHVMTRPPKHLILFIVFCNGRLERWTTQSASHFLVVIWVPQSRASCCFFFS